jgi:hypothetical protein
VVHKDLLMRKVLFFEQMFANGFLETSTCLVTLPEDSPEAFEVLVEWIYCSTLKTLHGADLAILAIGLAEKYLLSELGDRAMTFLVKCGRDFTPTKDQMRMLNTQTHFKSRARIYATRTVAWAFVNSEAKGVSVTSIQTACQDSDLLLDIVPELRKESGGNRGRAHTYPVCDYHNDAVASRCPYPT